MRKKRSIIKKKSILDYAGFMGSKGETGIELENRMRRNKKEREYIKRLRNGK